MCAKITFLKKLGLKVEACTHVLFRFVIYTYESTIDDNLFRKKLNCFMMTKNRFDSFRTLSYFKIFESTFRRFTYRQPGFFCFVLFFFSERHIWVIRCYYAFYF